MRKLKYSDYAELAAMIRNDPWHRDIFWPEFWYERNRVSVVIEDEHGIVMAIKLIPEPPAMRISIQFSQDPYRNAKTMLENFSEFKEMVKKTGAVGILYDTKNSKLADFCHKAFGFNPHGFTEAKVSDYLLLI